MTCDLDMIPVVDDSYVWFEGCEGVRSHSRLGVGDGSEQWWLPSIGKAHLRQRTTITFAPFKDINFRFQPFRSSIVSRVQRGPWSGAPGAEASPGLVLPGLTSSGHGFRWSERIGFLFHQPRQIQLWTPGHAERGPLLSFPVLWPRCLTVPLKEQNIKD